MSIQNSRLKLAAQSQQISKDIVNEDFYVKEEAKDEVKDKMEVTTSPTISKQGPLKKKPSQDDEILVLQGDAPPEDEEEEEEEEEKVSDKKEKKVSEELDTDFFEKVVDEDAEKKQAIEEIAGMSEIAEEVNVVEEEAPEEISSERPSAIQFKYRKGEGIDLALLTTMGFEGEQRSINAMPERRTTIYCELGPRYKQVDDEDLLLGFEIDTDAPIFFEAAEEEEEEVVIQEEEMEFKLIRAPYYQRHDKAAQEIVVPRMRNFILHKKLAMYFKRKKMDYVVREMDWSFDHQTKYTQKLEAYGDLIDCKRLEKSRLTQDLDETKQQKIEKLKTLKIMFKKMQDREKEIGYGLINTKTGKAIPDKHVEQLIRRQSTQMTQVSSMRLTFIKLKGMVQEKLDAISSLNEIAPGFLLADYEQLKSDNRTYADKMEEKEEELNKLRNKCSNTIQVIAHLREKASALDNDLMDLTEEQNYLDSLSFSVRSKLNEQKQNRDTVRHALNKMRDESGLLTQPTLLKDMQKNLSEEKILTEQLSKIMKDHKKRAEQIKTIRKKIEEAIDLRRNISRRSLTKGYSGTHKSYSRRDKHSNIYKGRPTLLMPVIEDNAFDSLSAIKPMQTYDRRQRNLSNLKHSKRKDG